MTPLERYQAATALQSHHEAEGAKAALGRRLAVQEMAESGMTMAQIGAAIGLTRARAHGLLTAARRVQEVG